MLHVSRVRRADAKDEDDLVAMCHELHRENGLFTMSSDRVREMLRRAFTKNGGIIGVIGDRGKLQGSIYLLLTQLWYSDDFHIEELWNYVRPEYRKFNNPTHAEEMIRFAKRCGDELGIPVIIGIMSNTRTEAKVRIYRRQLGDPVGAFFLHQSLRQTNATAAIAG